MDVNCIRIGAKGTLIRCLVSRSLLYNSGWMNHEADDRTSDRIIVIAPSRCWVPVRLCDLWTYCTLRFLLVWTDVSIHSKQTVLGVALAVLQPSMNMVVFAISFGGLARMDGAMGDEDRSSGRSIVPTAPSPPWRAEER